jgi:HlyD family secretion protein
MSFLKNKWVIALLAVLFIVGVRLGCRKDTTPKVVVEKVEERTIVETVDESGKLYPVTEMKVSVEPGSKVIDLYVQDGDTVRQGDAIATVEIISSGLVSARQSGSIIPANAMGQPNPAKILEALQKAQQPAPQPTIKTTAKTVTIYAPMTGLISDMNAKKGERILGSDLSKVTSINDWEIRTTVGEVDVIKLKEGQNVTITLDAIENAELKGTVYRIANATNNTNGLSLPGSMGNDIAQYKIFIKVHKETIDSIYKTKGNITLRTGMNANIKIVTNQKNGVISTPIKAVTTRYKNDEKETDVKQKTKPQTVVFVYENGKVTQRVVSIGIQDMEYIEIISGLKKGERIVIDPYDAIEKNLSDQMKVKEVDAKSLFKK